MTNKQNHKGDGVGVRDLIVADQHVANVGETAIAVYENRDVVRELVARLMMFHPAASEVGERGMLQAAQLALLMGASPFPSMNEIHVYTDHKDGVIVQPGINYWMRRAIYYGGVRWIDHVRPLTIDEIELYQVDGEFLGAICSGVRAREFRQRVDENRALGIDETTRDMLQSLKIVGLGVASRRQYTRNNQQYYSEAKNGRPLIWTAQKRAETDFYKKAFPFIPGEKIPAGLGLRLLEKPDGDLQYAPTFDDRRWRELGDGQSVTVPAADWTKPDANDPAAGFDVEQINDELGLGQNRTNQLDNDPAFDFDDPEFDPDVDGDPEPADEQPGLFDENDGD